MLKKFDKQIILEDGQVYYGQSFGAEREGIFELVFNTSLVGYQEILSDPSYTYQAVVMTYPLIGNYGMASDDYESERPSMGALIVREYNDEPSNFRSDETLSSVMKRFGILGVSGIDTRKLNRSIRDYGSRNALIAGMDVTVEQALKRLKEFKAAKDAVSVVSRKNIQVFNAKRELHHVVAIDCGMKQNIVRSLLKRGCKVTVVPWNTSAEKILSLAPDGVFISNGPGDPEDAAKTISAVKALLGKLPVFGICLGHQIISLASGAKTYKLKFGHRGGNHPVKNLETGRIEITSQNHSYAVDAASVKDAGLTITHINLLDGTIEGVKNEEKKFFSVQYHPESAPGPEDSAYLFDQFIRLMEDATHA